MRIKHSIKNMSLGILTQVVIISLGFISRKVFINSLGIEYLGVSGLLTNVISLVGLIESGVGISIIFNLYKPLSSNNEEEIIALIQLYKRIYLILSVTILSLSICIFPIVKIVMKNDTSIKYMGLIYFIYVFNNLITYLNSHNVALICADQKGYVLQKYGILFNILTTLCKIIILKTTQSYIYFLIAELVLFIINNLINMIIVKRRYPYLRSKRKINVSREIKDNIITNVKAAFMHKLGDYCVFGTDNLLITGLVGLKATGLYANYTMITTQVAAIINIPLSGISQSVGNLIASDSNEKVYEMFKICCFVNFILFSNSIIFLFNLVEPFISWFYGREFLLNNLIFIVIILNFYITGLRDPIYLFKTKAGLFKQDRFIPLMEAFVNLVFSVILAKNFGLIGILLGTTISTLALPFWIQPIILYKNLFKRSVKEYFTQYIYYAILTITLTVMTNLILSRIEFSLSFMSLVVRGIITILFTNFIYILVFYRTQEFKYLVNILNGIIMKIKSKNAFMVD